MQPATHNTSTIASRDDRSPVRKRFRPADDDPLVEGEAIEKPKLERTAESRAANKALRKSRLQAWKIEEIEQRKREKQERKGLLKLPLRFKATEPDIEWRDPPLNAGKHVPGWRDMQEGARLWFNQLIQRTVKADGRGCLAAWDESLQMAKVLQTRGKHIIAMGRTIASTQYLYPEEVLLLVDSGGLIMNLDNHELSFADCFSLLDEACIPFCSYIAYSHIRQIGYPVTRHYHYPYSEGEGGKANRPMPAIPYDGRALQFPSGKTESSSDIEELTYHCGCSAEEPGLPIAYDVYDKDRAFRRSDPGDPIFHVITCRSEDGFPDPLALQRTIRLHLPIPVKIVLTDTNTVTFYDLDTPESIALQNRISDAGQAGLPDEEDEDME